MLGRDHLFLAFLAFFKASFRASSSVDSSFQFLTIQLHHLQWPVDLSVSQTPFALAFSKAFALAFPKANIRDVFKAQAHSIPGVELTELFQVLFLRFPLLILLPPLASACIQLSTPVEYLCIARGPM